MSVEGWRKRGQGDVTLSERQMAVLGLLAEGRTNREIGEALGMTLDELRPITTPRLENPLQ